MSKNLERDFSLKDWVTKRAANSLESALPEPIVIKLPKPGEQDAAAQSAQVTTDISSGPSPVEVPAAVNSEDRKTNQKEQVITGDQEEKMRQNAKVDQENLKADTKIESVSQITARITSATAPLAQGNAPQQIQIVRLLRDLGDRLRQSEKEREILWRELDGCRKLLTDIEDKANNAEKAYISIEQRMSAQEPENKAETQEFQKAIESKVSALETTTGSAILRLEDAISENGKLSRKLDQITQDKVRLSRKLESMEETLTQTQDSLKAKALVLLTDAALANRTGLPQIPAYHSNAQPGTDTVVNGNPAVRNLPWWKTQKSSLALRASTAVLLVAVGLAGGWALSHAKMPNFKVLAPASTVSQSQTSAGDMSSNQGKLMDHIAQLANQVEPGDTQEAANDTPAADAAAIAPPIASEEAETLAAKTEKKALDAFSAEAPKGDLASRIKPDAKLPEIVREIETKALAGDAEAQHDLAAIYTAGHAEVVTDYDRALLWFTESAHHNVANAQYNLGVLYHQGLGVKQDIGKAISLYRVAASNNHPEAQYNLGIAHMEGVGADYNPQIAAYYFEKASAGGVVEAAYNLGLIQENGLLGESQPDEAVFWYKLAADHGNKQAGQALDQMSKQLGMKSEDVERIYARISAERPDALKVVKDGVADDQQLSKVDPAAALSAN